MIPKLHTLTPIEVINVASTWSRHKKGSVVLAVHGTDTLYAAHHLACNSPLASVREIESYQLGGKTLY
jgi:hypothetical protein